MTERLDKIVANMPGISRTDAKKLISSGKVTVDGKTAKDAKLHYDPALCSIEVMDKPVVYKKHLYILQNKPLGVVSSTDDPDSQTVLDILPEHLLRKGLFPAGRLDKYSQGMMIITDDGGFAHKMLSPKSHLPKTYYVELDQDIINQELAELFGKGVYLGGGEYSSPAQLEILSPRSANVTIYEGIYHQVRRMFDQNGGKVVKLVRIKIGKLPLDPSLPEGESRELTEDEIKILLHCDENVNND